MYVFQLLNALGAVIGSLIYSTTNILFLKETAGFPLRVFMKGNPLVYVDKTTFLADLAGKGITFEELPYRNSAGDVIGTLHLSFNLVFGATSIISYSVMTGSTLARLSFENSNCGVYLVDKTELETLLIANSFLTGPT
jgi:hypothetical protein